VKAANGAYSDAAALLAKIDAAAIKRDFIKQEVTFYQAFCAAKLALGGRGTINDAGRQLNAFVRAHPQNYHYFEAVQAMGDLLSADGKVELAQKQYTDVATKAPWPEYRMRAAVSMGQALQAHDKHAEAIAQFDSALAMTGSGAAAQNEKLSATLGKAISLAQTGKLESAVTMVEQVIQEADPEQKELHARAYNALGSCYQRAGQPKDALLAYLHVDVLYNTVPEAHAEALANLATLWQAIGQEARAREARQTLEQRYAGSRWAK
jgi:tetratricopeptide (TPR) repeat protein